MFLFEPAGYRVWPALSRATRDGYPLQRHEGFLSSKITPHGDSAEDKHSGTDRPASVVRHGHGREELRNMSRILKLQASPFCIVTSGIEYDVFGRS
jgi:hypothetical protein